jgi:hypothetical protein
LSVTALGLEHDPLALDDRFGFNRGRVSGVTAGLRHGVLRGAHGVFAQ